MNGALASLVIYNQMSMIAGVVLGYKLLTAFHKEENMNSKDVSEFCE